MPQDISREQFVRILPTLETHRLMPKSKGSQAPHRGLVADAFCGVLYLLEKWVPVDECSAEADFSNWSTCYTVFPAMERASLARVRIRHSGAPS